MRPSLRSLWTVLAGVVLTSTLLIVPPASAAPSVRGACDPIDPAACLLPFPNDWFTVAADTPTGRRVALSPAATPRNVLGVPVDPGAWNRNDGFSPGSMVLARVPGLDLAATGAAPVTDIGASLDPAAPIVLLDADTGERAPYWAELDANGSGALIVRPAANLREGHRYVVALRDLRAADGTPIAAGETFTRLAGRALPRTDPLYPRQRALKPVLEDLARDGIGTAGLYLAWDFTVASAENTTGRLLHMRDESFAGLNGGPPAFTVTSIVDKTPAEDPLIAREVSGHVLVPNYLSLPGGPPGATMRLSSDGTPQQLPGDHVRAPFLCEIPHAAFERPGQASLYGHGLLGAETEVRAGDVAAMAAEHDIVFCATRWTGMSNEDIPYVAGVFADFSGFGAVPDRLQQGMLGSLFLARAMAHADGLAAHEAFQGPDGEPVVDLGDGVVFDGNSQGGIAGGALVAVSTDIRRGVLGVPGMNYSTLLNRSSAFRQFQSLLDTTYPGKLDQQLVFAMLQMLWDRGEANGYAAHLTGDPLPGTPRHRVLLHVAFGDHQVSTVAAEVEARTIGARVHMPALAPGRSPDVVPYWGIRPLPHRAYAGSAIVVWDSGAAPPPVTNTPPTTGHDPHADPRNDPDARLQKAWFLRTGLVVDVCGGAPCTAAPVG